MYENGSRVLATSSVEHRESLEAWAREHGFAVAPLTGEIGQAARAVVASSRDVTREVLRRLTFEAPVVVVQVEEPAERRGMLETGTDTIMRGASFEEMRLFLEARLRAQEIEIGALRFVPSACTLRSSSGRIALQRSQARVLLSLWRSRRPLHHEELRGALESGSRDGGAVRTHIWSLRRAIAGLDCGGGVRIRSIRPGKYLLEVDGA